MTVELALILLLVAGILLLFWQDWRTNLRQRDTETTLKRNEALLRGVFESVTVGITRTDLEGRFVLANDYFCQLAGRSREELLEMNVADVTHSDDLVENYQNLRRRSPEDPPFVVDKRLQRPDGSSVWVRVNGAIVRDSDGRPEGVSGIVFRRNPYGHPRADLRASPRASTGK